MRTKSVGSNVSQSLFRVILLGWCLTRPCLAPAAPGTDDFVYELKAGESIWSISQVLLGHPQQWNRLRDYNAVRRERQLPTGTRIFIPLKWLKQEAVAIEIVSLTGQAHWFDSRASVSRTASIGVRMHSGDGLGTEAQSHVGLRLPDGSEVSVAPLSEIAVQAYRYVGTPITYVAFKVAKGRVETQVARREHPASRYEIITPTAQLGVRGTQFRVSLTENLNSSTAEVEAGMVKAINPTLAKSAQVELHGGFATIVRAGQAPLAPIAMLPAPDLSAISGMNLGTEVEYVFAAIPGAVIYRIVLFRGSALREVVTERVSTSPQVRFARLTQGTYHLRVRAIDSLGIEGRDARISFKVNEIDV